MKVLPWLLALVFVFYRPALLHAQIQDVHTRAGGNGFKVNTAARNVPSGPGDQDLEVAPSAFDWVSYNKELHISSHVDADPTIPAGPVTATARATSQANLSYDTHHLQFTSSGTGLVTVSPTHSNSGGGAVSALGLNFVITERCSYSLSIATNISTNGRTGSSESQVGFSGSGTIVTGNDEDKDFNIDLDVDIEDEPGIPQSKSLTKSGFIYPGTYDLSTFLISTNGETQPSSSTSYNVTLTVVANPGIEDNSHVVDWRGPFPGNFSDASKWLQQRVPDSTDTALFDAPGAYVVNVGAQTTNRLLVEAGNVTLANANYTLGTTDPDDASITVQAGALTLASGALHARHVGISSSSGGGPAGALTISNAGSSFDATGELRIGFIAPGRFSVQNGGAATVATARLGSANPGSTATVSGENSAFSTGNLILQGNSTQLSILDGGHVTSGIVEITSATEPQLFVKGVSGFNSQQSRWDIQTLKNNDGNLNILDGGYVAVSGNASLGADTFHHGTVNVVGTHLSNLPSQLDVIGLMNVGESGQGLLNVLDGGVVTATELRIGFALDNIGHGEVVVSGFNETLGFSKIQTDFLSIGTVAGGGGGLLTVRNGGFVLCGNAEIGGPGVPAVVLLSGNSDSVGALRSRNDVNVRPNAVIAMTDSLLSVDHDLNVDEGGSIQGTGVIICGGTVHNNGFIAPGLSPGILNINGNLEIGATGVLNMEAAGATPGTQADQLIVTGSLTMNGTLHLQFINGFAPKQGDTLQLLNVSGAVSGNVSNVVIGGLEPATANFSPDLQNGVLTVTAQNDTVALPVVALAKVPKRLPETSKIGAFILKRTGVLTQPLTVNYEVKGTATNGTDYQQLPGTATFPAGKNILKVSMIPVDDFERESAETIEIKIQPGDGYTPSLKSKAVIALFDNDTKKRKK